MQRKWFCTIPENYKKLMNKMRLELSNSYDSKNEVRVRGMIDELMHTYSKSLLHRRGDNRTVPFLLAEKYLDVLDVIRVYESSVDANVVRSKVSLQIVSKAALATNNVPLAMKVHFEMVPYADNFGFTVYKNTVLTCIQGKHWLETIQMLESIKEFQTGDAVVQIECVRLVKDALLLTLELKEWTGFHRLLNTHFKLLDKRMDVHSVLLTHMLHSGDSMEAFNHFRKYNFRRRYPDEIVKGIVTGLASSGSWERAYNMLNFVGENTMRRTMGEGPARSKNPRLLDSAFQFKKRCEKVGLRMDIHLYNAVLRACGRVGSVHNVIDLLDEMKRSDIRPNCESYYYALHACASVKNIAFMDRILKYIEDDGVAFDARMYATLMMLYSRQHRPGKVMQLYNDLKNLQKKDDKMGPTPKPAHSLYLIALAKLKRFNEALGFFASLKQRGVSPTAHAHGELMLMLMIHQKPEKALLLFEHYENEEGECTDHFMLTIAIRACGRIRHIDRGLELIHQMIEKSKYDPSDQTLIHFFKCLCMKHSYLSSNMVHILANRSPCSPLLLRSCLLYAKKMKDPELFAQFIQLEHIPWNLGIVDVIYLKYHITVPLEYKIYHVNTLADSIHHEALHSLNNDHHASQFHVLLRIISRMHQKYNTQPNITTMSIILDFAASIRSPEILPIVNYTLGYYNISPYDPMLIPRYYKLLPSHKQCEYMSKVHPAEYKTLLELCKNSSPERLHQILSAPEHKLMIEKIPEQFLKYLLLYYMPRQHYHLIPRIIGK